MLFSLIFVEINKESQYRENFVENPEQVHDENEYKRCGTDPGLVVIFNQVNFDFLDPRSGSNKDVNELIVTFGRLGFNIDRKYIHSDFTKAQIENQLKESKKKEEETRRKS